MFRPLDNNINSSLLGTSLSNNFIDIENEGRKLYPRRISGESPRNPIIVIILSAIIFVAIISIYDVIRNYINNYYAKKALNDPRSENTQLEIRKTLIANQQGLKASIIFATVCVIIAIIGILLYIHKQI